MALLRKEFGLLHKKKKEEDELIKKTNIFTVTAGSADPDARSSDIPTRAADSKNELEKQQQNGNLTNELMSELFDTPAWRQKKGALSIALNKHVLLAKETVPQPGA